MLLLKKKALMSKLANSISATFDMTRLQESMEKNNTRNVSTVQSTLILRTNNNTVQMSRKGFNLRLKISWQLLLNQLQSTTNVTTAKFIRTLVNLGKGEFNFLSSNWKVWPLYTGLSAVYDSSCLRFLVIR